MMEKRVRIFRGYEEADKADAAEEAAMTPEERLNILFELQERVFPNASQQRFERVARIVKLGED